MSELSELSSSRVREMMYGGWVAQAVYTAALLDVADLVADGTSDIEDLAKRTDTKAEGLYRLMRALAGVGVFQEEDGRRFVMTPLSQYLKTDGEDSVKDLVLFYGNEVYRSYGRLDDSLRSGKPAFDEEYGTSLWDHLKSVPSTGNAFRKGMGASSWREQLPLPQTYDFSGIKTLVDVGGGQGTMLAAILHERPEMRGILVEIPAGIDREKTMEHFADAGVTDRCTLQEGSAFDELPKADGYFMSCVLHAMDDESSVKALTRIRESIEPGGRVIILERIVPPGNQPGLAKFLDLTMMVMNGGKERTEKEWRDLMSVAGFTLTKTVATPYFSGGAELFAIEGVPAT